MRTGVARRSKPINRFGKDSRTVGGLKTCLSSIPLSLSLSAFLSLSFPTIFSSFAVQALSSFSARLNNRRLLNVSNKPAGWGFICRESSTGESFSESEPSHPVSSSNHDFDWALYAHRKYATYMYIRIYPPNSTRSFGPPRHQYMWSCVHYICVLASV